MHHALSGGPLRSLASTAHRPPPTSSVGSASSSLIKYRPSVGNVPAVIQRSSSLPLLSFFNRSAPASGQFAVSYNYREWIIHPAREPLHLSRPARHPRPINAVRL